MIQKYVLRKTLLFHFLKGSSNAYIILILFIVVIVSLLLSGGLLPKLVRNPQNTQSVQVADATASAQTSMLQLVNLQVASPSSDTSSVPNQAACLASSAVFILVDESDSMIPKMSSVKQALRTFVGGFPDESLIGLYSFSSEFPPTRTYFRELVPLGPYGSNKTQLNEGIDSISPLGGTFMEGAFTLLKERMEQARQTYPTTGFFVVFLSDGVPTGPNPLPLVNEIKATPLNASIYSVAFDDEGFELMQDIASSPRGTFFLSASLVSEIVPSIGAISQRICQ